MLHFNPSELGITHSIYLLQTLNATATSMHGLLDENARLSDLMALPSLALPPLANLAFAVGVGHQKYTCATTVGTFGTNVPFAALYDASNYLLSHLPAANILDAKRIL